MYEIGQKLKTTRELEVKNIHPDGKLPEGSTVIVVEKRVDQYKVKDEEGKVLEAQIPEEYLVEL